MKTSDGNVCNKKKLFRHTYLNEMLYLESPWAYVMWLAELIESPTM